MPSLNYLSGKMICAEPAIGAKSLDPSGTPKMFQNLDLGGV